MKIFFTLTILLLTIVFSAADTISKKSISQPSTTNIRQSADSTILTEAKSYKMLYDNAKASNDRMLETLHWALGLSIAFLLAIATGQFLFNYQINIKEIKYIKKDIDEKISEIKVGLLKDITDTTKDQSSSMLASLDKIEKEVKLNIDEQLKKEAEFLDFKGKLLDRELELLRKDFENDIKSLRIDIEKIDGDLWRIKGVKSNALSSYIRTANLQIELNREAKYILDDVIAILTALEDISKYDYELLEELTKKIADKHKAQKDQILALYKDKPVYDFIDNPLFAGQNSLLFGGPIRKVYKEKNQK